MPIQLFHVDAFADAPFSGNPAAVCLLGEEARDGRWMQAVAREMSLSETAFIQRRGEAMSIRWFTPTLEVDLCGHATLASAHVLWESGVAPREAPIAFTSRSGPLRARDVDGWVELDFPTRPAFPLEAPPGLLAGLGVRPRFVGRNIEDYLVIVDDEEKVRTLTPNFSRLRELGLRGVIVSAQAKEGPADFVSRFFAPGVGIPEDPVTGSAHCCLGPYWSERLGKDELTGYQASPRGGWVRVRVAGDRVFLRGQARTIAVGELRV
ncbi:MAG: PhzF family phenazine biosynthesis protein [Nannocystaceae bacterium]